MDELWRQQDENKKVEQEKTEKKNASKEEQKKDVAKVFGISLADIEEIHLPDGKEYFKFYNPEDKSLKMIENRKDGKNLSEQFKEVQQTLSYSQGDNSISNARAVFDYQLRYQNIELSLIPIRDLKDNRLAYRYLFDNLDMGTKKSVRVLLENIDFLSLEYINIENAIGVDVNSRVIHAEYNHQTGKCELKTAEVRNYDDNKMGASDNNYVFDVSDAEFDSAIELVDVSSDIPTITEAEEVNGIKRSNSAPTIRGRSINMVFALQAFQYPEIIERSEMSDFDKYLYRGIVKAIKRKKKNRFNKMTKPYQKVLVNNNKTNNHSQAAFVDAIFLALLAGFFTGMILLFAFSIFRIIF